MTNLIDRYVHQVGEYVPPKEREEIEAELRSQIQDQLDDRYPGTPTQAEIASVLAELGDPRLMAVRYGGEQYLVGPDLYPFMMMVLRYGWLLVPTIAVVLSIIGVVSSEQPKSVIDMFLETLAGALQATFMFSAVVVLIFAIIQRSGVELDEIETKFDPLELPEVDDPKAVDRFEFAFELAFGTLVVLVMLYFLHVGGLTLRFNLSDPGDVIPIPPNWTILLIISSTTLLGLRVLVLRRKRWNVGLWLTETVVEMFAMVCAYFVVSKPFVEHILVTVPQVADIAVVRQLPEIILISSVVISLVSRGVKLVKLWNYRAATIPFSVQIGG